MCVYIYIYIYIYTYIYIYIGDLFQEIESLKKDLAQCHDELTSRVKVIQVLRSQVSGESRVGNKMGY